MHFGEPDDRYKIALYECKIMEHMENIAEKEDRIPMPELKKRAVRAMLDAGLTVFSAESCTGGLFAKSVTDVQGASSVIKGGIVCYTNQIKISLLGVDPALIEKHTEVSPEVAAQMAERAREISGADIGVSSTGYASGGDSVPDGCVGLVYIALSDKHGTAVKKLLLDGDRETVRALAVSDILKMILDRASCEEKEEK